MDLPFTPGVSALKALLIEDEPDYARLLREILRTQTSSLFQVEVVERVSAALEHLAHHQVDVILVDLSLPDSQGLDTFSRVFVHAPRTPVVVLTSCDDEAVAIEAVRRGAQDYVVKGQVDGDMLARVIRYAIERKRANDALQSAHGQTQQLLEAIPSILVGLDASGVVTEWNDAARVILGVEASDIVGRPLAAAPILWDMASVLEGMSRCRKECRPIRLDDVIVTRSDGTPGFLGLTVSPTKWSTEEFSGFLLLGADVTDRRHAEGELSRLAAIVESSDDAIIGKTLDGAIISWNAGAEQMFGYRVHEVKGRSISILVPPGHADEIPEILARIKDRQGGAGVEHLETVRRRKDGRHIHVSLTISPIRTANGRVLGASTIARDITARKQLEQLKDEFISTVSHELRTPLSITREGVSLLLDGIPGAVNGQQQKVLSVARDNIDRLSRIINSLLDISKLEAGKVELRRERVELRHLLQQVADAFERMARERGLILTVHRPPAGLEVYVDADKTIQIFSNLVGNAIKFTGRGSVDVLVNECQHEVECVVRDTGVGIAKENLPKVFSKFQQFGRTAGGGEKGTGLGLAIAKELVELHHGTMRVESEPGCGTTFAFTLPKCTMEALLRAYLREGIQDAAEHKSRTSLLLITLDEPVGSNGRLGPERRGQLMTQVQEMLASRFCRKGDVAVQVQHQVAVLLGHCDRDQAAKVKARLEQALAEQLAGEGVAGALRFRLRCATYPDDANSEEELIRQMHAA